MWPLRPTLTWQLRARICACVVLPLFLSTGLATAQDDGPARGAPTTVWSWRVSVERAPLDRPAVAARDPSWTAVVTYGGRAPLIAANPIPRAAPRAINPSTGRVHALTGIASYYWQDQMTATGERFDKTAMTAAHKTLPLNTRVRVTNVVNGKSVVVRINDRGPYKPGRIIDLSEAAAGILDMHTVGLVPVSVEVIAN
jgi:rare lipoprotein A (peptidoglycan hydrolase)